MFCHVAGAVWTGVAVRFGGEGGGGGWRARGECLLRVWELGGFCLFDGEMVVVGCELGLWGSVSMLGFVEG